MHPLIILFIVLCINMAHASTQNFIVSPSLYVFDYAEYDSAGTFLDGETGVLPGIHFAYHYEHEQFGIQAQYSQYAADIDYDGHTWSGLPHQTQTDTFLRFYNLSLYSAILNQSGRIFFRYGSSYWDRNILSTATVAGLHEIYQWHEMSAGFRFEQALNPYNFWAELSILKTRNAEMEVMLPSEDITLMLGNNYGFRLEAGHYFPVEQHLQVGFSGFVEHWRFGASEPQYSIDLGEFILEPDSESTHWGLRLNIRYQY